MNLRLLWARVRIMFYMAFIGSWNRGQVYEEVFEDCISYLGAVFPGNTVFKSCPTCPRSWLCQQPPTVYFSTFRNLYPKPSCMKVNNVASLFKITPPEVVIFKTFYDSPHKIGQRLYKFAPRH